MVIVMVMVMVMVMVVVVVMMLGMTGNFLYSIVFAQLCLRAKESRLERRPRRVYNMRENGMFSSGA